MPKNKGGIEKASVSQMLQEIQEIRVYEWDVEIWFDPLKIADSSDNRAVDEKLIQKLSGENFSIRFRQKQRDGDIWIGGR